ncbi:hypothetical protein DID88_001425 [Monilinia fructigena]|uniref:Uncharacterized protein n=1 Tax=Monilinia fructigena TaxID=38457 RepID=A0A395J2E1_9HELO|nr:hypothetical protein DID88_001425 [Monilinia fructigena]
MAQIRRHAVDWSPLISTGKLVTGDMMEKSMSLQELPGKAEAVDSRPSQVTPEVSRNYSESFREERFASAQRWYNQSMDVRSKSRTAALTVQVSETDVNVMSWSHQTSHLLASGADDGVWAVWDLRNWKPTNNNLPSKPTPVASFNFHKEQITSVDGILRMIVSWLSLLVMILDIMGSGR